MTEHADLRAHVCAIAALVIAVFTVPLDGVKSVARMFRSVDLPAPFGPSRPTISPASHVNEIRDSAFRRP